MSVVLLALVPVYAQSPRPQPGFPGGGLWKAPPNRTVPFQVADGLVIVTGSLAHDGKDSGPMGFVIDTAATSTVVDADVAKRLGWKATAGTARYPGRTLELAGASISNSAVFGLLLAGMARQTGGRVEGVAGSDIFQHFAVRIDYVNHGLTLTLPESCATPEKKLPVRLAGGLPFVQATVQAPGGQPVQGLFLLDTGQPGPGLVLTSEFVAQHPELVGKQAHLPAFDSQGAAKDTGFARLGSLQLSGYTLPGVVATVAAPSAGGGASGLAGVIGGQVLSRFDVLVDLPHRWVKLKPNARFSDPFEADMSGMLLLSGETNGRSGEPASPAGARSYTIAGIAERSPASEAGLQQGDRLLSVGDRDTRDMTMEMIRGILKSAPGTKVMIGVDRSGKKMQVVLTLRRAI
jgi:hypothetical protein